MILTVGGLDTLELTGETEITCGAGVPLSRLAGFAMEHSLTGLEVRPRYSRVRWAAAWR